jgi:hypothetical protein
MKLEDQVCTLEQAKRLKELGIIQESIWFWAFPVNPKMISTRKGIIHCTTTEDIWRDNDGDEFDHDVCSAYNISELAAMIGKGTNAASLLYDAVQARMNQSHSFTICYSPQFLANCVIGLLETGHLTPAEINQRLK